MVALLLAVGVVGLAAYLLFPAQTASWWDAATNRFLATLLAESLIVGGIGIAGIFTPPLRFATNLIVTFLREICYAGLVIAGLIGIFG